MSNDPSWRHIVAEIEAATTPRGRARIGLCSIEGVRLCERALRAGATIQRGVVLPEFLDDPTARVRALRDELAEEDCELVPIPASEFEALTDGRKLGGVVALARLPHPTTLDEVLSARRSKPALLMACVSMNDPGNVGALVRTAHASGVSAVLSVGATDAFHPRSIRTSKGSVFRVPVIVMRDFDSMVRELGDANVRTVGAVTVRGKPLPQLRASARASALVLGSEAFGLSTPHQAALDELVTIPMVDDVDSFSVNAAAAVLLYEMRRGI